jgi:hypothetical protein
MRGIDVHVPPMPKLDQQIPLLGSHQANEEIRVIGILQFLRSGNPISCEICGYNGSTSTTGCNSSTACCAELHDVCRLELKGCPCLRRLCQLLCCTLLELLLLVQDHHVLILLLKEAHALCLILVKAPFVLLELDINVADVMAA